VFQREWRIGCVVLVGALLLTAGPAAGQSGQPAAAGGEEPPAPPAVALDKLLKIPDTLDLGSDPGAVRGGDTKVEWVSRFRAAHQEIAQAREALAATRAELEELSGSSGAWAFSAPSPGGAGPSQSKQGDQPLDYQLSGELRRNREEVERLERQLRELQIEANLAGVPEEWQNPDGPATDRAP